MVDNMFGNGNMYQLICKNSQKAISIQDVQNHSGSMINCASEDQQDITQLWFVDKVNHDRDYEICNALSGFCFSEEGGIVYLKFGKWASGQLYQIEKAPFEGFYDYYWIKLSKNTSRAICLEGVLRCVDFDQNDDKQMFRFQLVTNNSIINRTVMLLNVKSGRVVDVPKGSDQQKQVLVQWEMNKRFNQRWLFIKSGSNNTYQIQSFKNGLNLDINGQSTKPGTKVIQYKPTAAPNQLWVLQKKDDSCVLRSVMSPSLYLGVEHNSMDDNAKIVVTNNETLWKLVGGMI